ncbi:MAG: M13-type metalloendopeptidase [Lachnospiraceae bacterium]
MKKKKRLRLLTVLLAAMLVPAGCSSDNNETTEKASSETAAAEVSLKDDYYEAVNAEWLNANELSADEVMIGGANDLADEVDELLMSDFQKMIDGEVQAPSAEIEEFLKYYQMASDYDTRNEMGAEPLKPYLEKIESLASLDDLNQQLAEWTVKGNYTPVGLSVSADMGNASIYGLSASAPTLILPDKSYYDTDTRTQLLSYYSQSMQQMLALCGYSDAEAQTLTEQALEFDNLLVPTARTTEEQNDFPSSYNPVTMDEFISYSSNLDLNALMTGLIGTTPEKIIVDNPDYFAALNDIVTEENFDIMKSWMLVQTVNLLSGYLSDDFREAAFSYSKLLYGQTEMTDSQTAAYGISWRAFSPVIGDYYGQTYFGDEAKEDVTGMVDKMIEVYVSRLQNNDWLSDNTIQSAIAKLQNMQVNIGFPDSLDPLYSSYIVTDYEADGNLVSNAMDFSELLLKDNYAKYGTEVDRSDWMMSADTVNAQYLVTNNSITFPAGFLQAPYYSLDQSESENYGGIGAVIAHEITHGFDSNGAQYDETGSLNNWWTEEDAVAFEAKIAEMVELFDGREYANGTVNGTLTVTENIADAGGLSCAMEIVQSLPDGDQLSNLQEFQDQYEIAEGDGMYLSADHIVTIW